MKRGNKKLKLNGGDMVNVATANIYSNLHHAWKALNNTSSVAKGTHRTKLNTPNTRDRIPTAKTSL